MNVIIIGTSSGVGKEMALRYAAAGHRVGITGRRADLLKAIAQRYPQNIFVSAFDITAGENKRRFLQLIEDLGGLDLLIYNAGIGLPSTGFIPADEVLTMQTNANAFVEIAAEAFAFFVKKGKGQIAVTSSVAALRGNGLAPAYSASKAFVSVYAEGLNLKAKQLKKDIVVTDLRLGFVNTKPVTHRRFWVASPQKAARQMVQAIAKRKRVAYVSRRWRLAGFLLKCLPFEVLKRVMG